jgi:chaperonin GroEL
MREKKDRIDDAVEAVKAAIDRGVTIGGGYTFLQIALTLTTLDTTMGATLLSGALQAPFLQLCKNASIPEAVANEYSKKISLSDSNLGLDVIDNMLKPLTEYNVYDPAGVLIDSLSNAISVAKNILSIEAVIEPINYSKALGGAESAFPPGYPL